MQVVECALRSLIRAHGVALNELRRKTLGRVQVRELREGSSETHRGADFDGEESRVRPQQLQKKQPFRALVLTRRHARTLLASVRNLTGSRSHWPNL